MGRHRSDIWFMLTSALVLGGLLFGLHTLTNRMVTNSHIVFGAVYSTMNNPYYTEIDDVLREIIEGRGDILQTRYSDLTQDREDREVRELIDSGVDVLFIVPCEHSRIQATLEMCAEEGVPVFLIDTGVDREDLVVSTIQSDHREIGRLIAEDMKARFPESARILILYDYKYRSVIERMYGFTDAIYGDDRYEVVASQDNTFEFATANAEVGELLRSHQDIDVIIGMCDPAALGAVAALEEYRSMEGSYKDVAVYGVDASPNGKSMMERGKIVAEVAQHPSQIARAAALAAYDHLDGDAVDPEILIPVNLITSENLDSSNIRGWER